MLAPARLPLPTGGEHLPLDPNAELTVGEGEVRVTIPRFSPAHSAKYLIFSTRHFELPPDRPATFAVDMALENIGGNRRTTAGAWPPSTSSIPP